MTSTVLLRVAYDGARFSGWAPTPDERTVHDVLRAAIATMDPGAGLLRGASRTDAGVHARDQVAAFDASRDIESRGWVLGLGSALADDVAVRAAARVPAGFDPRRGARRKRYDYTLLLDPVRDPLEPRAWRVGFPLDLDRMAREANLARGTHDYRAFRSARDERQSTIRTLDRVEVVREDERRVTIVVEGNAFMHNMVRIIAGTLVDVGRGKLDEGAFARAIASGRREDLGETAPAHGLTLARVELVVEELDRWPR